MAGDSHATWQGPSVENPLHNHSGNSDIVVLKLSVNTPPETVSTPSTPTGPTSGTTGTSYTYSTGGSSSNLDHDVEYQFDWKGDGSDLSSWGSAAQSKTWNVAGSYNVKARARCKTDTSVVSPWSDPLTVIISPAPLPDLTGQWTSLTQACKNTKSGTKCKITGKFNLKNIGNRDVLSSSVRFYLSSDETYNGGDTLLKSLSGGKIKAGRSKIITLSYSFSSGGTASGKYIIGVIDADNTVLETDETNNNIVYGPIP